MKIKFFCTLIAICFTTSFLASEAFSTEAEAVKIIKTARKIAGEKEDAKDVDDIKTFDFERIFREADAYFEAARKWNTLKCFPKSAFVCSKHECPKIKMRGPSAIILNKKQELVAICRSKICQYYNANFEQTGVFINITLKGANGVIIRVLGDNRFKEVVMVGLDAYLDNGECEVLE